MNKYTIYKLEKQLNQLKKVTHEYKPQANPIEKDMLTYRIIVQCKKYLEEAGYKVVEQAISIDVKNKKTLLKYYYATVQSVTSDPILVRPHRDNKILANLIEDVGGIFDIEDEKAILSKIKFIIDRYFYERGKEDHTDSDDIISFARAFCRNKNKDGVNYKVNDIIEIILREADERQQAKMDAESEEIERRLEIENSEELGMFTAEEMEELVKNWDD